MIKKQVHKLALMLGLSSIDGAVPLAASAGLFKPENALLLAVIFIAGPGAILTACFFDGAIKERVIAALLAGLIATTIVAVAAGFGPNALAMVNTGLLKITGGIAVCIIGLVIAGIRIPLSVPTAVMLIGLVASILWR